MSTPPAPSRLWILFAEEAPVAVIVRRGPTDWTQLILWHTDTDRFEPGQWLHGNIKFASLSRDGRHIAMGVMAKSRGAFEEYTIVSRPPYFTALAISISSLCVTHVRFNREGGLDWSHYDSLRWRAADRCPYRWEKIYRSGPEAVTETTMESPQSEWSAPNGRRFRADEGKIIDVSGEEPCELFDPNPYQPAEMKTPEWAKLWGALPQ